ncbi:lytic murein transglycosylase B [Gammaproteobacteria bacterium 2W06]|nr:lytic murein transglycosylase B [Gammaproteobacteria bacterium 2W06]
MLNTLHRLFGTTAAALLILVPLALGTSNVRADAGAIRAFSEALAARHDWDARRIEALINDEAIHQPDIIEAIRRPAEAMPWSRYRPIFLTEARIEAGRAYQQRHRRWLTAVEDTYGVPAEIVVAIIGVETFYGRYAGNYRVLDALRTLGFGYPPRAEFFRDELEAFLVLAREEGFAPTDPLGSYAGAMGIPQFISSSYRAYAVDFNENGRRDLFSEPADAIGSIGHYLARHGWQADAPIAVPARVEGEDWQSHLYESLAPQDTVATLAAAGVHPSTPLSAGLDARLLQLHAEAGDRYWITLRNFYAITRYNHSALYAMAVHQLAGRIGGGGR